jgi:hypothetical protein
MKNNFTFDHKQYDFWPIYETIKRYYPIGIAWQREDEEDFLSEDYPGTKELSKLIKENIFVRKNFKERWGKCKEFLREQLRKPVQDTVIAWHPCYSGFISLKKTKGQDFTITKELHFAISLLGPYYTIYGLDRSEIRLPRERPTLRKEHQKENFDISHRADQVLTISPYLEYEQSFQSLQAKLTEWFANYKFVPYAVYSMQLEGLHTPIDVGKEANTGYIYSALFNLQFTFPMEIRGDEGYGFEQWVKEENPLTIDKQLILEKKLNQNIYSAKNNSSEVSLHRVWRYKSLDRTSQGKVFVVMQKITILDFTNPKTLLVKSEGSDKIGYTPYQVVGNEIIMEKHMLDQDNRMRFLVTKLTEDELRLSIQVHFDKEGYIMEGRIVEYTFEKLINKQ